MRLTDLEPRWLERDGRRVGFALRCPHCRTTWLTCTLAPTSTREQMRTIAAAGLPHYVDDDGPWAPEVVSCNPVAGWTIVAGATFDDMTVTPSLDASAAGHWHGCIQAGEIVGGI